MHKTFTIDTSGEFRVASTNFANQEIWDWQLKWLSVTGGVSLDTTTGTYNFDQTNGGIARRLKWNIGYSQKGDVNLDVIATDALLGANFRQQQAYSHFDTAFRFDFPTPFVLDADSGINVEARYELGGISQSGNRNHWPGMVINGYRWERGRMIPCQLAGHYEAVINQGTTLALSDADLWNDGSSEMYLTNMLLQPGQLLVDLGSSPDPEDPTEPAQMLPQGFCQRWRVNPSTGVEWMPLVEPIPVGGIAPYNRAMYDWHDQGPRAYTFPPETRLKPDQRVGIKLENLSTTDQAINICLFGLLEVE